MADLSPADWVDLFLASDDERRRSMASYAIGQQACWELGHDDRLAQAKAQRDRALAVVNEIHEATRTMSRPKAIVVGTVLRRVAGALGVTLWPI